MSSCRIPGSRLPPDSEGRALLQAGRDLLRKEHYAEARETILRAIDLIEQEGHTAVGQSDARFQLSIVYMREEKYQEAQDQLLQNIKHHQGEQDLDEEARDYLFIHMAHLGMVEYDQAEEALDNAIKIYRKMGSNDSKLLEGNAELFRGQIWEKRGDKQKALNGYETALKFYGEAEDTRNVEIVKEAIRKLQDTTSS